MDLQNKSVLVTGSTRGIGRATALAFAQKGSRVIINGRHAAMPADLQEELDALGAEYKYLPADISQEDQVKALVKESAKAYGSLDVVVNNAGIARDQLIIGMKMSDFDAVVQVNLRGTFMVLQKAMKQMFRQKSGVIINLASVVGLRGNLGQANYAAAKAGVIGLTKTGAKEGARRGVRVNAIAPGMIESDMTKQLSAAVKDAALKEIPLGRFGQAAEAAQAAVFLAENDYVTGQTIVVDGGMTI